MSRAAARQLHAPSATRAGVNALLAAACCALVLAAAPARAGENDPWEGFNRAMFTFNDKLDTYLLRPVARGWTFITPHFVRIGLDNFAANLRFPIVVVNDVLQWKWIEAGKETGRFAANSTVGLLGFVDVAQRWGWERQLEDSGQTFGVWGIPSGPYLVLPLLGPSNPRDTIGFAADSALAIYPFFVGTYTYITSGYAALNVINQRALVDDDLQSTRKAALDYYVFVRDAYTQRREALIRDEAVLDDAAQDDLYDLPEDEELSDLPEDEEEEPLE